MNRLIIAIVMMWSCAGMAQATKTTKTTTTETAAPAESTKTTETTTTEPAPTAEREEDDKRDSGGFFVEPAITYQKTDSEFNYGPLGRSDAEVDGFGVGARLGFHINEVFFVGMDGRYSQLTFDEDSIVYNEDAEEMNYGPVVGIQMPNFGLRIWGTYVAGGSFDPERSSSDLDVKFEHARGYRVGAGIRLASVSLNAEYQKLEYNKTKVEQIGPLTSPTEIDGNDLDTEAWIASISFPIEM